MSDQPIPPKLPPPIPPVIGKPAPVRVVLPQAGDRPRAPRKRRWTPVAVWILLGLVITVRLLVFPPGRNRNQPGFPGFGGGNGPRFGRPPANLYTPKGPIPADFWRVSIEVSESDAQKLRGYNWRWGGRNMVRPEALATVRDGTNIYEKVAMHLKGSAGSFRPFDDKPCITLNFSKYNKDQKFHGYSKISFNNSAQDQSYISEAISRELFIAAGVPTPRSGHATVLLNGRDLNLYVWTEGWGKGFLKRHFKNTHGNLYDGGFAQEIHTGLEVNSGDNPDDRSDLKRLLSAASKSSPADRWEALQGILDIDRFASFVAMEVMTCDWDGYSMNHNNTRIFHDLETDRMVFMPHGMDQMFGTFRSSPSSSIFPSMNGLVAQAFMSDPRGRRLYKERVGTLLTNVFVASRITDRVQELAQTIRPTLEAYDPDLAEQHDRQVENLCRRITMRAQSITQQLRAPSEIHFTSGTSQNITNWMGEIRSQARGRARFDKVLGQTGVQLQIKISGGDTTTSWRSSVLLPQGRYVFEAKAKVAEGSHEAGVALRVSGEQASMQHIDPEKWTTLRHSIRVDEDQRAVTLVAEFRARDGEIVFDQSSLRLTRE